MLKTLPYSATIALIGALAACSSSSDESGPTETGTLSGSVLNAPNPVGGVKVSVRGAGGSFSTTTSSNGTYTLTDIPVGSYTIDLCGQGVFDSDGNPIADKINLHLPNSSVGTGTQGIGSGPIFLPERELGLTVDTAGTREGVIAAGTVVTSPDADVAIVFAEATTVTFVDAADTTISITPVPAEQLPVALPAGLSTGGAFAIEPAGATFDVRPLVSFANANNLPVGTRNVPIYRLNYGTGQWVAAGVGTVSATGDTILSDAGEGLSATGWHTTTVETFCVTNVRGRVTDTSDQPIAGASVTTIGGLTAETDANGDFMIEAVSLPSDNFDVVVTVVPAQGSGFVPNESSAVVGMCGTDTEMSTIALTPMIVDDMAPTISASIPADGDVDVADNGSISVTFDGLMSPGSLTSSTLTLRAAGTQIDGQVGVNSTGGQTTATFLPLTALPVDAVCSFRVDASVMDAAGNLLGAAELITFTTGSNVAGGTPTVTVTSGTPSAVDPGATTQLTAGALDAAGATINGALVDWSSDAPAIATVDATGLVTTFAPGTANVSASFGGASDAVVVTVNTPVIDSIVLTGTSPVMAIGSGLAMMAEARDSGNTRLMGFTFDWTSSNDSIATVDANGNVRALMAGGPVTITATEPNSTTDASFAISVVDPANVTSVEAIASADVIGPGVALQASATAFDDSQDMIPGVTFTWMSSDATIAAVNASGLVTPTGEGSVQISATADGSSQIAGSFDLNVVSYEPTVVRILRGDALATPLEDVFVVLTDPVTGFDIAGSGTDVNGFADFGFTDAPRVTVTFSVQGGFAPTPDGGSFEERVFSAINVPAGRMTLTPSILSEYSMGVEASFPTGADTLQASAGGYVNSESAETMVTTSPGNVFLDVPLPSGWPILATTFDSASGTTGILSGGFHEPSTSPDGFDVMMTLTAEAVSSIPFSASSSMLFAGSRFLKDGLLFDQDSGVTESATSGVATSVAPPGSDRYGYRFMTRSETTGVVRGRDLFSDSEPSSLSAVEPDLGVRNVNLDPQTLTLSWETTGAAASDLDVGRARIRSGDSQSTVIWDVLFDASITSLVLPTSKGIPSISSQGLTVDIEFFSPVGVTGYDSVMTEFRSQSGRFNQTLMNAADAVDFVAMELTQFDFQIGDGQFGTVTYDIGEGPITVGSEASVSIPAGVAVTITATANQGLNVIALTCDQGMVTGVGTQTASVAIDSNESTSVVVVQFQSPVF